MASRREGEQTPYWKRMEVVMKVFMGHMTATVAAAELGITRSYYYQLEEEMLRAALEAVTPGKRGPKPAAADPVNEAVAAKLKAMERDKEILQIKVKHLEDLHQEMIGRGIGVLRGEKGRVRRGSRVHRPPVHNRVQTPGAVESRGAGQPGGNDPRVLPGDRPCPSQPIPMEVAGKAGQDRAPEAGGGDREGHGVGDPVVRPLQGRPLGDEAHVRGAGCPHPPKQDRRGAR